MSEHLATSLNDDRYFLLRLGQELYGTPLLGVREVIEFQEIKPVPNTSEMFVGVINLRGQILGVIDLRKKFGVTIKPTPLNAIVVFDTEVGSLAAIVDQVDSVASIPETSIDRYRSVHTRIPEKHLLGFGQVGDRLVTLLDLNAALAAEQIVRDIP